MSFKDDCYSNFVRLKIQKKLSDWPHFQFNRNDKVLLIFDMFNWIVLFFCLAYVVVQCRIKLKVRLIEFEFLIIQGIEWRKTRLKKEKNWLKTFQKCFLSKIEWKNILKYIFFHFISTLEWRWRRRRSDEWAQCLCLERCLRGWLWNTHIFAEIKIVCRVIYAMLHGGSVKNGLSKYEMLNISSGEESHCLHTHSQRRQQLQRQWNVVRNSFLWGFFNRHIKVKCFAFKVFGLFAQQTRETYAWNMKGTP